MIHTTIGIYPNGKYRTNGVPSEHLAAHIWYNINIRPGRALIVDNFMIHDGCMKHESDTYKRFQSTLERLKDFKHDKDTAPYH